MSSLGDWVFRALTGDEPGTERPWVAQLAEMRDRAGSGRKLAKQLGVNESTVRRMLSGKTKAPKPATMQAIRARRINAGARSDNAVTLKTTDRDSNRRRTLTNENLKLAPGTMGRVVDVYTRTGDKEAAAAAFLKGVTVPWYRAYLAPREGDLRPAPTGGGAGGGGSQDDDDDTGDVYYDDDGNAYEPDDVDEYYESVDAEDYFGPDWSDYGAEVG